MKYSEAKQVLEQQEKAQSVLAKYEKLAKAHEAYGFDSRRKFIKALQEMDQVGKGGIKGGGRGRGLTPETIDQIRTMKEAGTSNAEISRTLGVSPLTVGKYVKQLAGKAPAKAKAPAKPKAAAKAKSATRRKAPARRKASAKK